MGTVLDSELFGPLFRDEKVSELFEDRAYIQAMVDVEIALARAEARLGVIPSWAAEKISGAKADKFDLGKIARGTARDGFPVIALLHTLHEFVGPKAAPYVHWGATTQDVMDTAGVLQLRSAIRVFEARFAELGHNLSRLVDRNRSTVLAGRTHGQQALPISFGLKAAGWLGPLIRHQERLDAIRPRILVVQFGGGAGTLAALGEKGLAVTKAFAKELDLAVPLMPWHAQRDNLAEFAGWLSLTTGSLAKMAQDIVLLAQTEVGEAAETKEKGRGGSSTMPQKSNPVASELIIAAARTNASLLSAMHNALIQEHERGTHGWQMEWVTLPQMVLLTSGALKHAVFLAKNLRVDKSAMRKNLAASNDIVLAEAMVFALSAKMPRPKAEELVKKACGMAKSGGKPLVDVVRRLAGNTAIDWKALAEPGNYLGETQKIIDRVLKKAAELDR